MDLSDAWGIFPWTETEMWIRSGKDAGTTPSARVSEILRAGRAGLRVGNAKTLKRRAQEDGIWPSQRTHKLFPEDDPTSQGVALNR